MAWDIFFLLVGVVSGEIPIPSDAVKDAAVFGWVPDNLVYNVFVVFTCVVFVGTVVIFLYQKRLFLLILSSGYRCSVNTDGVLYAVPLDFDDFRLDGDNLERAILLPSQLMWRIIVFTWWVISQIDEVACVIDGGLWNSFVGTRPIAWLGFLSGFCRLCPYNTYFVKKSEA